jgi:hypothetical protein
MVTQPLTAFAVRPRRSMVALVPVLIVLAAMGCTHRRSSLRPVYVTPAPACTTPGCATPGAVPETVMPGPASSAPAASSAVEPSMPSTVEPSASSLGAPAEAAPANSTPNVPERAPSATPGPPPEEPSLLQPLTPPGGNSGTGGSTGGNSQAPTGLSVPRLQAPGTSQSGRRRPISAALDRASLREQLLPYTNNPDDLFAPPKADRPWKYVVLHHSATASGSYAAIDQEHRKRLGWEGCGYHFVIGNGTGSPDGQIEVAQRWSDQKHGIHCRNGKNPDVSEYGIGICLVGNLDVSPPTPRQIAAAQRLVTYLGTRYRIPASQIGTHADLASSPTACPGKYFPSQEVLGSKSSLVQR